MPAAMDASDVASLAAELPALAHRDWDRPADFDFAKLPLLARLLGLSESADVERLKRRLVQIVTAAREEEGDVEPKFGRSLADAWSALLRLDDRWSGEKLTERRKWLSKEWKTKAGHPLSDHRSFANNYEKDVYKDLARRLIGVGEDDTGPVSGQRKSRRATRPVEPTPWPVDGQQPSKGQEVVLLIAAREMRQGPTSGLVKLVREFEPYWRESKTMIYSLEGSYKEIWRAGLLVDYEYFAPLPAGFYGGLVHATEIVVAAAEGASVVPAHVVYLVDPHANSSLYPATAAIKRECLLTRTAFLTTYQGAARWFRLEWARRVADGKKQSAKNLLLTRPKRGFPEGSGLRDEPHALALAAHDRHKPAMMTFTESYADVIEQRFSERFSTRVTGHLLNGGSISDEEYAGDILYDVKGEQPEELMRRLDEKTADWQAEERTSGPGSEDWVRQLTRGRQGGVVQLARKVLSNECDTVVFLQDAETPREHDTEIQVLDRAAQLASSNCLLLYDEASARRWADNVRVCLDRNRTVTATSLVEAFRRVFDVELVLAHSERSGAGSRRKEDGGAIWQRVTGTAATHAVGALLAAARRRAEEGEPVRFGFAWGGTIRDVLGEIPETGKGGVLSRALGLHAFVNEHDATELHRYRAFAGPGERWPAAEEAPRRFTPGELRVVPTVGVIGAGDRSLESHSLVERAVRILGGEAVPYPESAFALSHGLEDPLGGPPEKDWENLDLLLLTAAPLLERPKKKDAALATALPADLANFYEGCEAAVGTIYLEKSGDGVAEREPRSYRQAGISMKQIQALKSGDAEVVLINGAKEDSDRISAAWAALKAGLPTTFVTDEAFAWAILKKELPGLKVPGR